jgi:hypothetical protein
MLLWSAPAETGVWSTIGLTVLTALFATMAVEWLAKPRLEARKERVLGHPRKRDELAPAVLKLGFAAQFLTVDMPTDLPTRARENLLAERRRTYARMQSITAELADGLVSYADLYFGPLIDLVPLYITHVQGVIMSARIQVKQARMLSELTMPTYLILRPPRMWMVWRWPALIRAPAELRRLIADQIAEGLGACQPSPDEAGG